MKNSVGFIGCGQVSHFHADVLVELGCEIRAVCGGGPDSENAQLFADKYEVPLIFDGFRELLNSRECDLLWVVTPWDVTENLLIDLLEDGRPVMVEKPLATSSRKLAAILDQCSGRPA